MQDFVAIPSHPEKIPPLSEYISLPSLAYAKDISSVLHSLSFSQEQKDGSHFVYLHYTEGSSLYTLGWCNIYYSGTTARVSTFATANLRGLGSAHKKDSQFASQTHLLRTPISGIGSKLFEYMVDVVKHHDIFCIKISSDMSSVPFYTHMSKKFSEYFTCVETNSARYGDGGCDFVFTLK